MTQRLNAWSDNRRKYGRVHPSVNKNICRLQSIFSLRLIPEEDNIRKVDQLKLLLKKAKYNNKGYGNFVYSLDEKCIPLAAGKVIDNMPIDYSMILDYSLEEIIEKNKHVNNSIAQQNLQLLQIIKDYLNTLLQRIDNPETGNYIIRMNHERTESLEEALQRILVFNQILWQSKHKLVGLGRLDKILDRIPVPEQAEVIICDFLKTLHTFYNFKSSALMGDTGQIILLGGLEPDGSFFYNEYTELFIRCIQRVNLPDPKCLLRVSTNMPDHLYDTAIDCIATGLGSPLLSNDDVVIPLLIDFGYDQEDAYDYGVSACWEPLSIGNSLEQNNLTDIEFGKVLNQMVLSEKFLKIQSFPDVLSLYEAYLQDEVKRVLSNIDQIEWEYDPILTLFTGDCQEKDLDISQGGAKYNDYGILSTGLSSAVNSLINIKRFCIDEQKYSPEDVQRCIAANYEGYENILKDFSGNSDGFGTDSDFAAEITNHINSKTAEFLKNYRNKFGGRVKFGLSSPSYIHFGNKTGATADGRKSGVPFSTHISRDDNESITQILNFASKIRYCDVSSNANVVDIMVQPNLLIDNREKFKILLQTAIREGVFQIQFNVVSYAQLVDAKAHPEKYPGLIVRVWGFSAYFKDLPESYQDMLIDRAKKMEGIT